MMGEQEAKSIQTVQICIWRPFLACLLTENDPGRQRKKGGGKNATGIRRSVCAVSMYISPDMIGNWQGSGKQTIPARQHLDLLA